MPIFTPKITPELPSILREPILVDQYGMPRYWSLVWQILKTNHLSESTKTTKLRQIESLYHFVESRCEFNNLDSLLSSGQIDEIGNLLEAYFVFLQNSGKIPTTGKSWENCIGFLKEIIQRNLKTSNKIERIYEVENKIQRLHQLYGQLKVARPHRAVQIRSLPYEVVEELYEILDPESPRNPYSNPRIKWTILISFTLMLQYGLRRGELLLLRLNSLHSAFDDRRNARRYWINIGDDVDATNDSRRNRPSIKTVQSIRQIPISENVARMVKAYSESFRGKANHPYLLNSQWSLALSHDSLTAHFKTLSEGLSQKSISILNSRTQKTSITPHDLRHTCAVIRLNQLLKNGDSMDEALEKMRSFFGWSLTSDMPRKYAKAVFEDRLSEVWGKYSDDRMEILRLIPRAIA